MSTVYIVQLIFYVYILVTLKCFKYNGKGLLRIWTIIVGFILSLIPIIGLFVFPITFMIIIINYHDGYIEFDRDSIIVKILNKDL